MALGTVSTLDVLVGIPFPLIPSAALGASSQCVSFTLRLGGGARAEEFMLPVCSRKVYIRGILCPPFSF